MEALSDTTRELPENGCLRAGTQYTRRLVIGLRWTVCTNGITSGHGILATSSDYLGTFACDADSKFDSVATDPLRTG